LRKIIEINHINVDYDMNEETVDAITDVSLDIYQNDFVCILGPSGCGKSTLLKTIAGFIKPNKGTIQMNGIEIENPDSSRGVVFQEPNLFPWLNVKQNVCLGPSFLKKSKEEQEEIAHKYLEQVELLEFEGAKVFELSGGQKQRVAIARTLANQPEVILMDEPFGALDSFTRKKMQTMIRSLWKQNQSTILFVTHDIEEALLLGTKIYVMKKGDINLIANYDITYTCELIDNPKARIVEEESFISLKEEILNLLEE